VVAATGIEPVIGDDCQWTSNNHFILGDGKCIRNSLYAYCVWLCY
jgi:hypothetical protein